MFGIEFLVRRWVKEPVCIECETERRNRGYEMAAEQAYYCGFNDGMESRRGDS